MEQKNRNTELRAQPPLRESTKGATYNINYHLVWCPRYRRPILTGLIAARLTELFKEIAKKWEIQIIAHEVMPDHVHLFVSAPPKYSPAKLAQLFKGTTSYVLRLEFPRIKQAIWKVGTLWSPGYYVGTAGNVSAATIQKHIEECHLKGPLAQNSNRRRLPARLEAGTGAITSLRERLKIYDFSGSLPVPKN